MDPTSPLTIIKRLDAQLRENLRTAPPEALHSRAKTAIVQLQQNLVDARIYMQAYAASETREEQLKNAKTAKKWLRQASRNILNTSEHGIFSAADVAHLSAQIEQLIGSLV